MLGDVRNSRPFASLTRSSKPLTHNNLYSVFATAARQRHLERLLKVRVDRRARGGGGEVCDGHLNHCTSANQTHENNKRSLASFEIE